MSTETPQPAEDENSSAHAEKPARPSGKPSIQTEKITEDAIDRLPDEIADGARAVREAAPSHRAVFAALVAHPDEALSTSEIAHEIFYTQGGVYNAGNGPLADAGLVEMDEDNTPTVFYVTDLGVNVAEHLRKMLDVDLRKLRVDYYAEPDPEPEPEPEQADADADADEDEGEDDDDPHAELFSCTIGDCDFAHERRRVVEKHISNGTDGGHGGRSGTEAGVIEPPSSFSEGSGVSKDPIARLNKIMESKDKENGNGDSPSRVSKAKSKTKSKSKANPTTESGESASDSSSGSGQWQTWSERPAASWDEDDVDVDLNELDDIVGMLHDEIGKMAGRVQKDKVSNLNREEVRCGQLAALANSVEALVKVEKTRAELGALQAQVDD